MATINEAQRKAISDWLETHELPVGLGTEESACSIAAINLALNGKLTDKIPECMSEVIGKWIIGVQDAMPHSMRNSSEWKSLLPLAAGTGRENEQTRLAIIMNWQWTIVLPSLQSIADQHGFGDTWSEMCKFKTGDATYAAADAAAAAADAASTYAAADAAAVRADAAATYAARAVRADAAATYAARAADAAAAATYAAADADAAAQWKVFKPCALLKKLIEVN